jgi:hypothetical protein
MSDPDKERERLRRMNIALEQLKQKRLQREAERRAEQEKNRRKRG